MRRLAVVAALELERRWTLLPLGLAIGLAPFLLTPLLGAPAAETQTFALMFSLLLATATAILLGATAMAGDLAGGRLGFYYSRPLAWWQIWGGKLAAAAGLTLATGLLAFLPALLVPRGGPGRVGALFDASGALYMAALIALALGVVQWGTVAVRARSAWLVLDIVAIPLVAWGFGNGLRRMFENGLAPDPWGYSMLAWPMALAFHLGGALQAAHGRTALRRSHALSSIATWCALGVVVLGWQIATRTVFRPEPARLARAWAFMPGPANGVGWVAGSPRVPGFGGFRNQSFLVDAAGQARFVERGPFDTAFAFSADGTRTVGLSFRQPPRPELFAIDVESGREQSQALIPVRPHDGIRRLLADAAASRVLALGGDSATVFDVATGRRLASFPASEGGAVEYAVLNVAGPDRFYRAREDGGYEIEASSGGELTEIGQIEAPAWDSWSSLHLDADGDRVLALGAGAAVLADAASGEILARFETDPLAVPDGLLLSDGRLLIAAATMQGTPLRLYSPTGESLAELDLGPSSGVHLIETRPGRVVASVAKVSESDLRVVDTDPLRIARSEENLFWRPAQGWWRPWHRDRLAGDALLVVPEPTNDDRRFAVFRYDVETGTRTWVAGPR